MCPKTKKTGMKKKTDMEKVLSKLEKASETHGLDYDLVKSRFESLLEKKELQQFDENTRVLKAYKMMGSEIGRLKQDVTEPFRVVVLSVKSPIHRKFDERVTDDGRTIPATDYFQAGVFGFAKGPDDSSFAPGFISISRNSKDDVIQLLKGIKSKSLYEWNLKSRPNSDGYHQLSVTDTSVANVIDDPDTLEKNPIL